LLRNLSFERREKEYPKTRDNLASISPNKALIPAVPKILLDIRRTGKIMRKTFIILK
jgi:hypothetical protein